MEIAHCPHRYSPKVEGHAVCFHCAERMAAGRKAKPQELESCRDSCSIHYSQAPRNVARRAAREAGKAAVGVDSSGPE